MRWGNASAHYNGKGLERIPDLVEARRYLRRLSAKGQHSWRGAVCASMTGGTWSREWAANAGIPLDTDLCARCGKAAETDLHRCWTCPANDELPECKSFASMKSKALSEAEDNPALWLRGILPSDWVKVPPVPEVPEYFDWNPVPDPTYWNPVPDPTWAFENIMYGGGDAAGTAGLRIQNLQRIAWAYVVMDCSSGASPQQACLAPHSVHQSGRHSWEANHQQRRALGSLSAHQRFIPRHNRSCRCH